MPGGAPSGHIGRSKVLRMGKGSRPTVRWKNERIKRKKERDRRRAQDAGKSRAEGGASGNQTQA